MTNINMEEIFAAISREAGIMKLEVLKEATSSLMGALRRTEAESRSPGFDISLKCFQILKIALESGSMRLCSQALSGFQILLSQRIEALDENLPKLILEAIRSSSKIEEEMHISIMKIILTIWNTHNIELSFSIIRDMIDQCILSFTESTHDLPKAAAQATISHIITNMCNNLIGSLSTNFDKISRQLNLLHINELPTTLIGYSVVLTSKLTAILSHLSECLNTDKYRQKVIHTEIILHSLTVLVDNFPEVLCNTPDVINIIEKLLKTLTILLSTDCLARSHDEKDRDFWLFKLTIKLLLSITIHVEFDESLRRDFCKIINHLFSAENELVVRISLEFIKDIFQYSFQFSNLFFVYNTVNQFNFAIDLDNILKIIKYFKKYCNDPKYLEEKIIVHKIFIVLTLTLDNILMQQFNIAKPLNHDICCDYHRIQEKNDAKISELHSICNGKILNLPTFKILNDNPVKKISYQKNNNRLSILSQISTTNICKKFISPTLPNSIVNYRSKSFDNLKAINPIYRKYKRAKSCVHIAGKPSIVTRKLNIKVNGYESQRNANTITTNNTRIIAKSIPPAVNAKRDIKTLNMRQCVRPINSRKIIPPKNIPISTNKIKNEKTKTDEIISKILDLFFTDLTATVKEISIKNSESFSSIDRNIQKFSLHFIEKCDEKPYCDKNMSFFKDIYAEDIYYTSLYILCLSNCISDLSGLNFEEFFNYKFYPTNTSSSFICEFRKTLMKYIYSNPSFLVMFHVPGTAITFRKYILQSSNVVLGISLPKTYSCISVSTPDILKIQETILENIVALYIDTECASLPSIDDSIQELNEFEWDIRLESFCLLCLFSSRIGKWSIVDKFINNIIKMIFKENCIFLPDKNQRISISKISALQTLMKCALDLVEQCCMQSFAWEHIFRCCSYIVQIYSGISNDLSPFVFSSEYPPNEFIENHDDQESNLESSKISKSSSTRADENMLSEENSFEAVKCLMLLVEEFFAKIVSKQSLDDIIFILDHIFPSVLIENQDNTKEKSSFASVNESIRISGSDFLLKSYVNLVVQLLNKKYCSLIFMKRLSSNILTVLCVLINSNNTANNQHVIDFFHSFFGIHKKEIKYFMFYNFMMVSFFRSMIQFGATAKNAFFDIFLNLICDNTICMGSCWHSVIWCIQNSIEINYYISMNFQKMTNIGFMLNQLGSAPKLFIYAIPDIITDLLAFMDFHLTIFDSCDENLQIYSKFDNHISNIEEIIKNLLSQLPFLTAYSTLVTFYKTKKFNYEECKNKKLSFEIPSNFIEIEKYIRLDLLQCNDSQKSILQIFDTISKEIFLLYYDKCNSVVSEKLVCLFDLFLTCTKDFHIFNEIALTYNMCLILTQSFKDIKRKKEFTKSIVSFKHLCNLYTNHVTACFHRKRENNEYFEWMERIIQTSLQFFSELTQIDHEIYSRLGCSCFKHVVIMYCSENTPTSMPNKINIWKILIDLLDSNIRSSLSDLNKLISCFSAGSKSAQGDLCRIKIFERSLDDIVHQDGSTHIIHSARHILQTEDQIKQDYNQEMDTIQSSLHVIVGQQKLFQNGIMSEREIFRINLNKLLEDLMVNQIMLDLCFFLVKYIITEIGIFLSSQKPKIDVKKKSVRELMYGINNKTTITKTVINADVDIPEMIKKLKNIFKVLTWEWEIGIAFDARPGLKYLLQRLCALNRPANFIKASTLSFTSLLISLFQICCLDVTFSVIGHHPVQNLDKIRTPITRVPQTTRTNVSTQILVKKTVSSTSRDNILRPNTQMSKLNINELKDLFGKLCLMIDALQECSPSEIENVENQQISSEILTNSDDTKNLLENIEQLKKLTRDHVCGNPENWTTDIGSIEIWSEERRLHLNSWISVLREVLNFLLIQSNPQFKLILSALFKSLSSLIAAARDPNSQKMLSEVIMRCGIVYGIV